MTEKKEKKKMEDMTLEELFDFPGIEIDGDFVTVNGKRMKVIEWLFSDITPKDLLEKN